MPWSAGSRPDQAGRQRSASCQAELRDRALILIGFAAALGRSELVALTVADVERVEDGVLLHIRRSKTDQEGEGHAVAVPHGTHLRPIEALDAWLEAALSAYLTDSVQATRYAA